jgi:hypothetical protein
MNDKVRRLLRASDGQLLKPVVSSCSRSEMYFTSILYFIFQSFYASFYRGP